MSSEKTTPKLSDRFELTLQKKSFQKSFTYMANVTSVGGNVSGGGSRTGYKFNKGYQLTIRNLEKEPRSYWFSFVVFSNESRKIIKSSFGQRIDGVQPGYAHQIDIEPDQDDFASIYLEEMQVIDERGWLENPKPHWNMYTVAEPDPNPPVGFVSIFRGLLKIAAVLAVIFIIIFVITLISAWIHFGH